MGIYLRVMLYFVFLLSEGFKNDVKIEKFCSFLIYFLVKLIFEKLNIDFGKRES